MIYKKFIISASFLIKNVEDDFQFMQKDRGSRIATKILKKNKSYTVYTTGGETNHKSNQDSAIL